MSEPFLAEVRMVGFTFAPRGWALCDGQLLPINQNQALFSLLGTIYGGDGRTTFGLPDLRGRTPIHFGNGFTQGQRVGEEAHTLDVTEMPAHSHAVQASNLPANRETPTVWTASRLDPYTSADSDSQMNPASIANTGGSQAHSNMQPFLAINFVLALQGVFPSRN